MSLLFTSLLLGCQGQQSIAPAKTPSAITGERVGGPFENGEFMYIGMPREMDAVDTSAGWTLPAPKLLITGVIYRRDGRTPAPGVILYYYHTDHRGYYTDSLGLDRRVVRHGYIRGWVKTDEQGRYAIYTIKPGPYPGAPDPAHIHPTIKEPGIDQEYYIDEFVFDDDPRLTGERRKALLNRGGSGILRPELKNGLLVAEHSIVLGLNIPSYPSANNSGLKSGLDIGMAQPSFMPDHVYGPDKSSKACPVCKYGRYQGILYFIGVRPDWQEVEKWVAFMEAESKKRKPYFKAYLIWGPGEAYDPEKCVAKLASLGKALNIEEMALTLVPSFSDTHSEIHLSEINGKVDNTLILYRQRNIADKYINLKAGTQSFAQVRASLDLHGPYTVHSSVR